MCHDRYYLSSFDTLVNLIAIGYKKYHDAKIKRSDGRIVYLRFENFSRRICPVTTTVHPEKKLLSLNLQLTITANIAPGWLQEQDRMSPCFIAGLCQSTGDAF